MSSTAAPVCSRAKLKLNLPSGYHFLPTDAELVVYYLRPRLANANHRLPLPIFVNERILNYHPDKLIEKYRNYGEGRWFFFTDRECKHVGGNRPNRTTPDNGHWNATGSIRPIRYAGGVLVGCRRTLVFYEASRSRKKKNQAAGLPPTEENEKEEEGDGRGQAAKAKDDGVKTEWTMYEYESLASEAEFEAIRRGDANKIDGLVLCTIQKKKRNEEGVERKKSTKRKTKEEGLELEAVPAVAAAGDVEHGSRAGTTEGQDEDHVQRALVEEAAAAAAEPLPELAYHAPAPGVGNFNVVDPNLNMPYYYFTNSLSPVPTPSQEETLMAPASGDNRIMMHQDNYYFINHSMDMKNSQSFAVQETPPQEFLPNLYTNMAAPQGGGNTMDHMLRNVLERSTELPGEKPNMPLISEEEEAWWISSHHQANLPARELNSHYVTNSLSFVPTSQQETTVMALAAREYNHTAMHQPNYVNHSMNMRNYSQSFHVQAALPQEEFLPYSSTYMAAPIGGGNVIDHHIQEEFLPYSSTKMTAPLGGGNVMDHHTLQQNSIENMTHAAEAHTFTGFFPGLSSSNYGHLSTRMDHPGPSSVSLPSQQSHGAGSRTGMQGPLMNNQVNLNHGMQGPLLNNQVNLNHQSSATAASSMHMVGYDQSKWRRFSTQDSLG